jgi:hypothetical protein
MMKRLVIPIIVLAGAIGSADAQSRADKGAEATQKIQLISIKTTADLCAVRLALLAADPEHFIGPTFPVPEHLAGESLDSADISAFLRRADSTDTLVAPRRKKEEVKELSAAQQAEMEELARKHGLTLPPPPSPEVRAQALQEKPAVELKEILGDPTLHVPCVLDLNTYNTARFSESEILEKVVKERVLPVAKAVLDTWRDPSFGVVQVTLAYPAKNFVTDSRQEEHFVVFRVPVKILQQFYLAEITDAKLLSQSTIFRSVGRDMQRTTLK